MAANEKIEEKYKANNENDECFNSEEEFIDDDNFNYNQDGFDYYKKFSNAAKTSEDDTFSNVYSENLMKKNLLKLKKPKIVNNLKNNKNQFDFNNNETLLQTNDLTTQYYESINKTTDYLISLNETQNLINSDSKGNNLDKFMSVQQQEKQHSKQKPEVSANTVIETKPQMMQAISSQPKFKLQQTTFFTPTPLTKQHSETSAPEYTHHKRPLIKIKSTSNIIHENLRAKQNESEEGVELDRTIESAQINGKANSNGANYDNQHMMWVRLIQATMDAT